MALLDDLKVTLRVSHDALDQEIMDSAAACVFDMANKGVSTTWLGTDPFVDGFSFDDIDEDALPKMAKRAIATWVKFDVLMDNDEAERFIKSYDSQVCSLLNSRFNAVYETDEEVSDGALGLGNYAP